MRLALIFVLASSLPAQEIAIRMYSEYQRVSPLGDIVMPDRAVVPREVISPLVARNGHATFHIAVTALPGTIYYIATQSYPHNIVELRLYKETFELSGREYIPDGLVEVPETALRVAVMPDYNAPDPSRTTEVYLLDIFVPPSTPPGIVRVEALAKTADWRVAPIELRIAHAIIPAIPVTWGLASLPPLDAPADRAAWDAIFQQSPQAVPPPTTVRALLLRNALEDSVLARRANPQIFWPRVWSALLDRSFSGAESFLPIRNYLLRALN